MLKKLAKTALLGTDRSQFSKEVFAELEVQGIDTEANATQVLLEAAAIYSQKEKAGFPLLTYKESLPESAEDNEETVCSEDSAFHLKSILNGKFKGALSEFIEYLVEYKKQLPPEMLPEIIEQQLGRTANWEALKKIVGKRGEWLMRLHPNWQKVLPIDNPELWATGSRDEREGVLRYLRTQFPELALEMLQQTWDKKSPRDCALFLEVLTINLSIQDESFLEKCLDEKNKDTRIIAATLLARIPNSKLLKRIEKRLDNYVFFKNGDLIVSLPEEADQEGKRDGLFGKMKIEKQGMRAAWLVQIVSFLPPKILSEKWNLEPLEIFEAISKTDYSNLLFSSILLSTKMNKNSKWAENFLRYSLKKGDAFSLPQEDIVSFMSIISATQYNAILKDFLPKNSITQSGSELVFLISHSPYRLSSENTIAIIDQYKKLIFTASNAYGNTFTQKETLKILAYQCNFEVIEQIKKGWDMNSIIWRQWADEIEKFTRTMLFRKAMKEELSKV